MGLFNGHECCGAVGEGARTCPHCGGRPYPPPSSGEVRQQLLIAFLLSIVLLLVFPYLFLG